MSSLMSVGGLVSGLDTNNIISQLEQIARAPITRLQQKKQTLQAQNSAWNTANNAVLAVKNRAAAVTNLASQMTVTGTSSDSSVSIATSATTVAGNYVIKVNALSSYDQFTSSTTYSDTNTTSVGSGTLTLAANGKSTEIAATNLTLNGLAEAINNSDSDVSATIMSDGATTPAYRLVLTAKAIGTKGAITIGGDLTGWGAGQRQHLVTATDTSITLGDSENGGATFTMTRAGNTLTDVIPGATINLKKDSVGKTVNIAVNTSTDGIKGAIAQFVEQVNILNDFVKSQNKYDEKTGETGMLFGDYRLKSIYNDVISMTTSPVSGLPSTLNSLNQLGVSTDTNGRLVLDSTKLDDMLKSNQQGVFRLFGAMGTATSSLVSFAASSTDTVSSSAAGYAVEVTQAAVRGRWTQGLTLPDTLAQDESLVVNTVNISLTSGMTREAIRDAINLKSNDTGVLASLTGADGTGSGNYLTLQRTEYGAGLLIQLRSSLDAATVGSTGIGTGVLTNTAPGAGNMGVEGKDVAGTINGEAATGLGQHLTSATGTAKGLKLLIRADAPGSLGTVAFTNGIGAMVGKRVSFITENADGTIKSAQKTLDTMMTDIDDDIVRMEASVKREMTRMRNQFNAMEVALSRLQSQAGQLNNQIAALGTGQQ